MDRICGRSVSIIHFLHTEALSNLIFNFVVLKNVRKGLCKVYTSMGACHLHNIKKKADRNAFLLKVYGNCHIGLVVRRRPGISSEVQCTRVFLCRMCQFHRHQLQIVLTRSISEIFLRVALNTWFTSRATVRGDGM